MSGVEATIIGVLLNHSLQILTLLCGIEPVKRGNIEEDVQAVRRDLRRLEAILRNYNDAREENIQHPQMDDIEQLILASFTAADALEGYGYYQLSRENDDNVMLCRYFKSIKNLKSQLEITSGVKHARATVSAELSAIDKQGNINQRDQLPYDLDNIWKSLKEDALLKKEDDLVGIEAPRKKLMALLLEDDSRLKVISVVGMGGRGKTTLVKKVFDDVSIKNSFTYNVWTTISQSFKMDELLKDIIRQIYTGNRQAVPPEVETMKSSDLKKMVHDSLSPSSYLLILDDVWSRNAWNAIQQALPKGDRSRIVLTTRDITVAPAACQEFDAKIHRMDKLSDKESKRLFLRKAFKDGKCPPHLEETVESILKKCDGLPLAINTIGGFLRKKGRTLHEWEKANSSLGFELRMDEEFEFMRRILSVSYSELPDELKSCFLYLSMFPEDYTIEYNRLIRLWMAEKFIQPIEEKTVEEVAEEYFTILLNRNLIQAAETTSDGRVKTCRVHDILHKICILKSRDQKFAAIHKEGDAAWPDKFRRLSIHNTLQNVNQIKKNSHLRALFVFGLVDSPSKATLHELLFKNHSMIRLLDLQAAPLIKQFPREITKLVHLRYLSLRLTKVGVIPSCISKLKNLETLDLKHALVTKLPASIVKLQNLRVLLVYRYDQIEYYTHFHYKYGFKPPNNIGKLRSLQKLCFLEATQGKHMLIELGKLSQLRRLGVTKLGEEDGKALCSSIKKLSQLRALSITSKDEEEIIDLPAEQLYQDSRLRCLQHLQRLYLTGPLRELPKWVPMVNSLVRLSLKGSRLTNLPLADLQDLPELLHLELLQVYNGKKLHFQNGGFRKLKVLGLDKFDELETIKVDKGAMPSLEKLIIQRCTKLRKVPKGIQHLKSVKVFELFDMHEELIERLRPGNPDSENWKISHISQVYSTNWNKGWESQSLGKLNERESFRRNHCWK
ncbi:Disease resistance protein [Corchorus olitorius]|uniref:Disease resistance protein n=1 Tax=Corchorus olitorius TaxID=93759 RepID=A0A1R3HFX1_9ROSI|nr:Disease resistance protein [Corchorus olitorius]